MFPPQHYSLGGVIVFRGTVVVIGKESAERKKVLGAQKFVGRIVAIPRGCFPETFLPQGVWPLWRQLP